MNRKLILLSLFCLMITLIFLSYPKSALGEIATAKDWIGLFPVGVADGKTNTVTTPVTATFADGYMWVYANSCTQTAGASPSLNNAGGCSFALSPIPASGNYEFRLYAYDQETPAALISVSNAMVGASPSPGSGFNCPTQATNPRVQEGLISTPSISNNFGNPSATCVISNQAAFAPFKTPGYDDLKSIYFDQSKLQASQKITLTGNQTQTSTNSPINIQGSAGPGVVTFDSASSGSVQASSLSWSHTIGAGGSNRFLLVGISIRDSNPPDTVSSATFAGQNLTFIGRKSYNWDASIEMWYLLNPPTGTNTVTVTLTGTAGLVGGATSWTGVNQASPLGTFASAGGFSTTPSVDVSSTAGEVVVDVATRPDGCVGNNTVGPGQTQRWNRCQTPGDTRGLGSSESGASTVTMSWTIDNEAWAIGAVPIKPAPAALEKIYHITGDLTINNNITVDKTGIIFIDGSLTINTNLTHTNNNAGLVFVVKGDVVIAPSVTQVDAVLISSGRIYTAGSGCSHTSPVPASQLVVNGSLISLSPSNNIEFCRTLGAGNTSPAELINNEPKYLVILRDLYSDTLQKWSEIE